MGERIKKTGNEAVERWHLKMPRFFRLLVVLCCCTVGTAFGVNTMLNMTGAVAHEWWTDIYPLLIGVPTGMAIVCKLTVAGGYKDIDPDDIAGSGMLGGAGRRGRSREYVNMSDVETQQAGEAEGDWTDQHDRNISRNG